MAEEQGNEDLRRQVSETLYEIYRKLEEKGVQVPYAEDELKENLNSLDKEILDKVKPCLEGIGKSIVKLASDDPTQQMSGALDIVASVTGFIPSVGPIIAGICLLVSNVIMAFGAKPKVTNITAELEHVLEKVIGEYHDYDVKAGAAGIKAKLQNIQTYIDGYTTTDPSKYTEQDVVDLASKDLDISIVGVEFLGQLEFYIREYSVNKDSEDEDAIVLQARRVLEYIKAYLELSSTRKLLLSVYYCLLLSTGRFEAKTNCLLQTIQFATDKEKEIADIVPIDYTTPEKAVLASVFNLSEHPVIEAFNRTRTDIAMDGRTVLIKPKIRPNGDLCVFESGIIYTNVTKTSLKGRENGNAGLASCFTFKKVGDDDIFTCKNLFYKVHIVIKQKRTGDKFDVSFGNGDRIKLIRLFERHDDTDKQLYLITLVEFPARFVYQKDKKEGSVHCQNAKFKVGDPGEQGYWYLDQAGAEKARSRSDSLVK